MKAKVIATGEIVNVIAVNIDDSLNVITRYIYKEIDGTREWYDHELFFNIQEEDEKSIDWEQRRFELIKAIMQGLSANPYEDIVKMDEEELADLAISYANVVIAKLKEQ